jgi:hypothetical protein
MYRLLRPLIQRRFVSVSTAATPSANTVSASVKYGPHRGAKRSRLMSATIGFLIGGSVVGVYGWYEFLDDYRYASRTLIEAVEDIEASSRKLREYARKIDAVDASLRRLEKESVVKEELTQLRQELRQLLTAAEEKQYAWNGRIVDLEKDFNALFKSIGRQ